jgi:hypothetical protein
MCRREHTVDSAMDVIIVDDNAIHNEPLHPLRSKDGVVHLQKHQRDSVVQKGIES